jgi:hypothetical protein
MRAHILAGPRKARLEKKAKGAYNQVLLKDGEGAKCIGLDKLYPV